MKNGPIIIGIVNAALPGFGYLIIQKRVTFGWLMLLSSILYSVTVLTDPSPAFDSLLLATSDFGRLLETVSFVLITFAFGYDAYDLTRTKGKTTAHTSE